MKTNIPIQLATRSAPTQDYVAFLIVLLVATLSLLADTVVTSRDERDVVGTWIGYDDNRTYFARIELYTNGTGLFALTYVTNVADLYRVESWRLEKLELKFSLSAIDKEAEPVLATGQVGYHSMRLALTSTNASWRTAFILFSESRFAIRNELARHRIEKFKQADMEKTKSK